MIKRFRKLSPALLPFVALVISSCNNPTGSLQNNDWVYDNIEFDLPRVIEPSFPDNEVNIADLGAIADGQTLNTAYFTKAIELMAAKGGGKVIVPSGIWMTGPIVLKSNINLHLEDGALIRFSPDFELYPLVESNFEGKNTYRCLSPLSGNGLENIAITGKGVIDGSGEAWRPVKKSKLIEGQWKKLLNSGGVLEDEGTYWFPSEKAAAGYRVSRGNLPPLQNQDEFMKIKDFLRPVMVSLVNCKVVLLDGVTFQNSPAWNIHPLLCEDLSIRNLTVRNPWYSQNGDGLDLESCKNVVVYNNNFDVGDDAICLKSGKDKQGRDRGRATENVIIKNNIVYHGHGGFVVGSEMSGGVRNVHVSDCTFMGTNVGIRFKSARGRGGVVENIYISNINMTDIPAEPIRFNMFYGGQAPMLEDGSSSIESQNKDKLAFSVTEETPVFRNIHLKNIVANGFGKVAVFIGLPELKLENLSLENAVLSGYEGFVITDASGIKLKNVKIFQKNGPALTIFNSKDIEVENLNFNEQRDASAVAISGKESSNIMLNNADFKLGDKQIQLLNGAGNTAVVWK